MILLDNVVSEMMRPDPARAVRGWLDVQLAETLFFSSVGLAELLLGVAILPSGARKAALDRGMNSIVKALFAPRMLVFDEAAARRYAVIVGEARKRGRTIAVADGQIAAIASTNGLMVATRDPAPFHAAGLTVIDPWRASP